MLNCYLLEIKNRTHETKTKTKMRHKVNLCVLQNVHVTMGSVKMV